MKEVKTMPNKHDYAILVIGYLLDKFEVQANDVKRAIMTKADDNTLSAKEATMFLSIFEEFIEAQDEVISKVLAKELMVANNVDHSKDPIS